MPEGRHLPSLSLPSPVMRRAVVVGAGSFGTAVPVLLARGGLRTTLQTRAAEQARRLQEDRENRASARRPRGRR
jgi:glycerol-3-phosphate dehydrogenase (NAD(P)+)